MKKIFLGILVIFIIVPMHAQSFFSDLIRFNRGGMISLQWNIGQPTGSMNDFIEKTSFTGINIDFKHCYQSGFVLGGRAGWQFFKEDLGISNIKNSKSVVYKEYINKISIAPIMVTVDYLFNSNTLLPYAGIGIGGFFVSQSSTENNTEILSEKSFSFGISPEIGITIPFIVTNIGMNINTKYNYAFGACSFSGMGWFEFNIGISIMY